MDISTKEVTAKEVGERVKTKRLELGLTQTSIRELTGISSGNMSDIENGNRLPSIPTLVQLCQVFDCTTDYLLWGQSPISENDRVTKLTDETSHLIELFLSLSDDDRDEILLLTELKYNRSKKKRRQTSSRSNDTENSVGNIA